MPGKKKLQKMKSEPSIGRKNSAIRQLALRSANMLASVDEEDSFTGVVCNSDNEDMADDLFSAPGSSAPKTSLRRRGAVAKEVAKRRSSEPNISLQHSINARKSLKQVSRGMSEMHGGDRALPIQRNSTRLLSFSGQSDDFSSFLLKDNVSLIRYLDDLPPDRSLQLVNQRLDVEVEGVYDRFTPLGYAISENDADMTLTLLSHGADVNGRPNVLRYDENQHLSEVESPLHFAALFKCKPEIIDHLLAYGADVDDMSPNGHLAITRYLAGCQAAETISKLVEVLADGNQPEEDLVEALHFATSSENEEAVRVIVQENFNINARRVCKTALLLACKTNNGQILKLLLDAGSLVNECDQWNRTPLHFAVKHCSKENIQMLLHARANVDAEDRSSRNILNYVFLKTGNKLLTKRPEEEPGTIVGFLLEASDTNLKIRNPNEFLDALHAVLMSDTAERVILQFIVKHKAFLQPDHRGEMFLHTAIRYKKREVMEWLLKQRISSVNDPDIDRNWTAIHHAVATKDPEMIQTVLDHGADINTPASNPSTKSGSGITPLCLMIRLGLCSLAERYIQGGCTVNTTIRLGGLLLIPCTKDDPPLPLELYNPQEAQDGLATARRNKKRLSLVELAIYMDQYKVAFLLVEAGALSGSQDAKNDALPSYDKIQTLVQSKLNQSQKQCQDNGTGQYGYLEELHASLTHLSGSSEREMNGNGLADSVQSLNIHPRETNA